MEYDNQTIGVEKLHIIPNEGNDYYLEHDTNQDEHYLYSKNGESYVKSTISASEYSTKSEAYTLIVKEYLDEVNENMKNDVNVYIYLPLVSETQGFPVELYIEYNTKNNLVNLDGTMENPHISIYSFARQIHSENYSHYSLRSTSIQSVTLPQ